MYTILLSCFLLHYPFFIHVDNLLITAIKAELLRAEGKQSVNKDGNALTHKTVKV